MKNSNIGERLRYVRTRCGVTRKDVEKITSGEIKSSTLSTIENGQSQVSIKLLGVLLNFYKERGVTASYEWVITGEGVSPAETDFASLNVTAAKESGYFIQHNKNAKIITSTTDRYFPFIETGDFIGIVKKDSLDEKLKMYILEGSNGSTEIVLAQRVDEKNIIYQIDNKKFDVIEKIDNKGIHEVIWIRKNE